MNKLIFLPLLLLAGCNKPVIIHEKARKNVEMTTTFVSGGYTATFVGENWYRGHDVEIRGPRGKYGEMHCDFFNETGELIEADMVNWMTTPARETLEIPDDAVKGECEIGR